MAEEFGEKTEAPTPRRRQEAREQGNIARSTDLTSACVVLGTMVMLKWYGRGLVSALKNLMHEMLSIPSLSDWSSGGAITSLARAMISAGIALAPVFAGVMLIAIAVNLAQVGLVFSGKRLQPNFGALNPVRGAGKLFGGGQGPFHLLMNLLKLALVGAVAYSAIHGRLVEVIGSQNTTFAQAFGLGAELIYTIAIRLGLLLLLLAIIDYAYQRYRIEQDLKMTKQEVKEEMRRMEGDPQTKQRRKQIAMQIAMQRLKKDVPKADVIVTNPTEFAVALQYDAASMHAPKVVAKGRGYMAMRIRELAIAHGVPILERKPLARALYKLVQVGQEIPEQFYAAVAEILAYVYELSGKLRRKSA
jgi:flagellar biosynthetic protein FlhB